jgi:hypothetical protein
VSRPPLTGALTSASSSLSVDATSACTASRSATRRSIVVTELLLLIMPELLLPMRLLQVQSMRTLQSVLHEVDGVKARLSQLCMRARE